MNSLYGLFGFNRQLCRPPISNHTYNDAIRAKPTPNGKKIQKCYNITKNVSEIWHVLIDNSLYNHCFRVNICDKYTMGYNKS